LVNYEFTQERLELPVADVESSVVSETPIAGSVRNARLREVVRARRVRPKTR
jgi:hypothetical protein